MSFYKILIDGVARRNHGAAGIGVVITGELGQPVSDWSRYLGITTHNLADYEALIEALEQAVKRRMAKIVVFTDSKLLLRQVTGQHKVKNKELKELADKVDALIRKLSHFEINYINKQDNKKARQLAEEAIAGESATPVQASPKAARPLKAAWSIGGHTHPVPPHEKGEPVGDGAPAGDGRPVGDGSPPVSAPVPPPEAESAGEETHSREVAAEAAEGVTWRVLAFTPQIMLVQFNYKKGAVIPVHRHTQEQAGYVIKGRVKYMLADKEVIMGPGMGIAVQGNSDHGLEAQLESIEIVTYAPMRGDLFHK